MNVSQLEEGILLVRMSEAEFKVRRMAGFMREFQDRKKYPPTIRDIGKALGWSSSSTTYRWIETGEAMGLIASITPRGSDGSVRARRYYAL